MDPRILDLNASFLLAREVMPLGISGGRLTLGMRNPDDIVAISAVRFVTRMEVDPVAIDENAWAGWRASLTRLCGPVIEQNNITGAQPPAEPAITIRLSEQIVHVRLGADGEVTFAADEDAEWANLLQHAGAGASVAVVLLKDTIWRIELAELPEDARSLRRVLNACAPLRADDLAWSLPMTVNGGTAIGLSLVRRRWLEKRLASIATACSPANMIVTDEAGRRFNVDLPRARRTATAALAWGTGLSMFVLALLAGTITLREVASLVPLRRPVQTLSRSADAVKRVPTVQSPTATLAVLPQAHNQADRLELVGVVGRLPHDAVALVRPAWGRTVTLRVGDSLLGWRLATIAADRVILAKGATRREVVLAPVATANAQSM